MFSDRLVESKTEDFHLLCVQKYDSSEMTVFLCVCRQLFANTITAVFANIVSGLCVFSLKCLIVNGTF